MTDENHWVMQLKRQEYPIFRWTARDWWTLLEYGTAEQWDSAKAYVHLCPKAVAYMT